MNKMTRLYDYGAFFKNKHYWTYGLADMIGEPSQLLPQAFCTGKCANKSKCRSNYDFSFYRIRGIGRAKLVRTLDWNRKQKDKNCCVICGTPLIWSDKYSVIIKEGLEIKKPKQQPKRKKSDS
jgi:hypothetical protein